MFAKKSNKTTAHSSSSIANNTRKPFFQPRIDVGKANDKYEIEADTIADKVVAEVNDQSVQPAFFAAKPNLQKFSNNRINQNEKLDEIREKPLFESVSPLIRRQADVDTEEEQNKEPDDLQLKKGEEKKSDSKCKQSVESVVNTKVENSKSIIPALQLLNDEVQEKEEEEEEEETFKGFSFLQKNEEVAASDLEKERKFIQAKKNGSIQATSSLDSQLNSSKEGSPLSDGVKNEMESGFGVDFSDVKIHTDSQAVQMSRSLGAQAFTHGNNIYFNQGKYQPTSTSGKHLLAHELTHTIQQGASVRPKMIQRVEDTENISENNSTAEMNETTGVIDESAKTITFREIPVPGFKLMGHRGALYNSKLPLKRKRNYLRGNTNQREGVWKQQISTTNISSRLTEIYRHHNHAEPNPETIYIFKANITGRTVKPMFIGTLETILPALTTPNWGKNKEFRSFDVDHIVELQLANWNEVQWPNTMENMELLDSSKNRSSGSSIKNEIDAKVRGFHELYASQYGNVEHLKNAYTLVFNSAVPSSGGESVTENEFWTRDQIETGEHLTPMEAGSLAEIGGEGEVRVFPNESGGLGKRFRWSDTNNHVYSDEATWLGNPFRIVGKQFNSEGEGVENTANLGTISVNIPASDKTWKRWPEDKVFTVIRYPGSKYAGYLTKQTITSGLYGLRVKKASPVEILSLDLLPNGISASGQINPSIPLFRGNPIEFTLANGIFEVSKTFEINQINLPPPFEISNTSLTIFASTENGLGLRGQTNFAINQVGDGHIEALASTSGALELVGEFNFDSNLFNPAQINVEYKNDTWTIGGEIGIPSGKVRGVKSATITASYSENNFSATGQAELDIPGIDQGTMTVNYGNEGFSISGNFNLSSDVPGIRSGRVEARIAKTNDAENYDVMVSGTAQPDIPGINSTLSVSYENGAITIEGSAAYNRGMLSGTVSIGATNRAIGEDGQPTGVPNESMRVYGGGSLTLQLTPWLEATAGVKFLPNGELEINGRIALPDTVNVFDRIEFRRNLFTVPTVEIPLFAIPLGPRSLGLVAQISGGLDFSAGFGPGQLRAVSADVTYNPDHEDQTTINGHGEFAIPADAGLTLRGDLGLGLSIAIASLSGGIELAGTLGLEGEALATVDLSWSPGTGIVLDAKGRITVNPKFSFDVNAFARASLGIGWFSISETWRHNLVSFSWGPDIQFGIVFPVHYQENQPFDISFDDIQVIYPQLDVVDMAKNLARDIKDDIFD